VEHQKLLTDSAINRHCFDRLRMVLPATQPIDPSDNDTFWHGNEYYPATSNASWSTRIGKFNFAGAVPCANKDFDHDDKPDYVLYNGGTHQTAVWYMNNNAFAGGALGPTLPPSWNVMDVADFNRNGNLDYALFNASTRQTAIWYMDNNVLVSGEFGPTLPAGWSIAGLADFDGDGKLDYLLFRPSTGQSAIWYLSGVTLVSGAFGPTLAASWGLVAP
jgi:hypothetical protein